MEKSKDQLIEEKDYRCNTCGCYIDSIDNLHGYCSESCFREQND